MWSRRIGRPGRTEPLGQPGSSGRGELSFSKVRALTRAATADNEAELLEFARASSAAKLERLVRGWKRLDRDDEARAEKLRHRSRGFSVFPDAAGMYAVKGRLPAEVGAVLMRAVEAASDALFTETGRDTSNPEERPEPRQLRADAVGLIAERALAAGFGTGFDAGSDPGTSGAGASDAAASDPAGSDAPVPGPDSSDPDASGRSPLDRSSPHRASNDGDDADTREERTDGVVSGTRAERYQVVVHMEAASLARHGEPGLCEMEDGTRVTAETARRLACDSGTVEMRHASIGMGAGVGPGPDGPPDARHTPEPRLGPVLDVGRRTRTVPPALRRALEARDRGCRFPGCGLRFTDAHHIEHWADGGETRLDNLVLLCRRHHRRVHEGGYRVCSDRSGQIVFFTPDGDALFEVPELPKLDPEPVRTLVRRNRGRGVRPHPLASAPRSRRDRDVPWALEARAREALEPSCRPRPGGRPKPPPS